MSLRVTLQGWAKVILQCQVLHCVYMFRATGDSTPIYTLAQPPPHIYVGLMNTTITNSFILL